MLCFVTEEDEDKEQSNVALLVGGSDASVKLFSPLDLES